MSYLKATSAIIVAAGKAKRFGTLKQFVNIAGKPLLYHAVLPFQKCKDIDRIIIVVPEQSVSFVRQMVVKFKLSKVSEVVAGGRLRQDSVQNGLEFVSSGIAVVHDGVRPFVKRSLISSGVRLCRKHKAVVFGLPVLETVKIVKRGRVLKTIERSNLYVIQTPQFFDAGLLKEAYRGIRSGHREFTDDAAVVEHAGAQVYLFPGSKDNVKITYRDQLAELTKLKKRVRS